MEPSTKDQILIDNNQMIPFNYQNKIAKCAYKFFNLIMVKVPDFSLNLKEIINYFIVY